MGDGSYWFPRRHKCAGDVKEGLLIDERLLTQRAIDPPSACEGCGVVPGQGEHDRSCPVVSAGN
jgi:hypothetical protein